MNIVTGAARLDAGSYAMLVSKRGGLRFFEGAASRICRAGRIQRADQEFRPFRFSQHGGDAAGRDGAPRCRV